MSGGGSYGLNLALANDQTTAQQNDFKAGDNIAGALKIPVWLPVALIAAAFVTAVVWIVRSTKNKS